MAGSRIRSAIPHHIEEEALGFDKVSEGLYRLIKQVTVKDTVTLSKISSRKQHSKELYRLVEHGDFDYQLSYNDIDGTLKSLAYTQSNILTDGIATLTNGTLSSLNDISVNNLAIVFL